MIFAMSVGEFFPLGQGFRGRRAPAACQVCSNLVGPAAKRAQNVAGPANELQTWHGDAADSVRNADLTRGSGRFGPECRPGTVLSLGRKPLPGDLAETATFREPGGDGYFPETWRRMRASWSEQEVPRPAQLMPERRSRANSTGASSSRAPSACRLPLQPPR